MPVSAAADTEDKRAIYVGNLPIGITEDALQDIFCTVGSILSIKLIGKSTLNAVNYAFVEYDDPASAEVAIETFNGTFTMQNVVQANKCTGRAILGSPVKVNWAYTSFSSAAAREATSTHFSVFVGDLAAEIDDDALKIAFCHYQSLSDARIMWDMSSGRSRGYGFCAFVERADAERAVKEMQGQWLGTRQIRCNWANLKLSTSPIEALLTNPGKQQLDVTQQYALVLSQAAESVSTVYLGNLSCDTEVADVESLFHAYGGSHETKLHADRGFAFLRLASHDIAALAIVQLQGSIVKGRPVKMSWQNKPDTKTRQRSSSNAAMTTLQLSAYPLQSSSYHHLPSSLLLNAEEARMMTPRHQALPSSTVHFDTYERWNQQLRHAAVSPFANE
ncbi:Nuclear and cytoplasmic polyadenylated RNA-binding protein pub1 [Taphrina deformans PYCC 5710]|uniref:Nuclear and cytoplasmic polyadenylated RNA-binding protein pub1 n=1 Tax=Taphrina deformans (strain PYCC 5710 / ATCC 11124 / CBS 356.35 / IMI 108563 / JCM 9778 / NBRC 8474) TaxID=1097556 RepID=R4X7L3_TAPDE|nr:Nuclear and cytoplasmic polyadenylated RNA-binding protein pub1 [Taphrina deformans PYCC 5710]|eukprot:CCG81123.1 Nuclear and cytoplasmic polyadenylated RNA-binding protein pub1 [Taphrina deformans PYCC 5710]